MDRCENDRRTAVGTDERVIEDFDPDRAHGGQYTQPMMIERVDPRPRPPDSDWEKAKLLTLSQAERHQHGTCDKYRCTRSRRYFFAVLSLYADLRVPNLDAVIFTVRKRNDEGQRAQQNQNRSDGCGDLQLEIPSSTVSQLIVPPE